MSSERAQVREVTATMPLRLLVQQGHDAFFFFFFVRQRSCRHCSCFSFRHNDGVSKMVGGATSNLRLLVTCKGVEEGRK